MGYVKVYREKAEVQLGKVRKDNNNGSNRYQNNIRFAKVIKE